ncbi:MAG: DUF502 domain-containing protein [Ilyomonas sp.]
MLGNKPKQTASQFWKKMLQFLLQGLLVLTPIGVTIAAVIWLFTTIDNFLPNIVQAFFPDLYNAATVVRSIPGMGLISAVLLVIFIGWLSSSFIVSRVVSALDTILENTPGIKFIYTSVKDFIEAFAGNKKKFDKPVLVNVDAEDVWRIGFITQTDAHSFQLPDHLVVYVPHSYAISGITYVIPKTRVKLLDRITPAEAMKFVVSGGVTEVEHGHAATITARTNERSDKI